MIAAGCMDGNLRLVYCGLGEEDSPPAKDCLLKSRESRNDNVIRHLRYMKMVCWSPTELTLASASAGGGQIGREWAEEEDASVFAAVGRHRLSEVGMVLFSEETFMDNADLLNIKDGVGGCGRG